MPARTPRRCNWPAASTTGAPRRPPCKARIAKGDSRSGSSSSPANTNTATESTGASGDPIRATRCRLGFITIACWKRASRAGSGQVAPAVCSWLRSFFGSNRRPDNRALESACFATFANFLDVLPAIVFTPGRQRWQFAPLAPRASLPLDGRMCEMQSLVPPPRLRPARGDPRANGGKLVAGFLGVGGAPSIDGHAARGADDVTAASLDEASLRVDLLWGKVFVR